MNELIMKMMMILTMMRPSCRDPRCKEMVSFSTQVPHPIPGQIYCVEQDQLCKSLAGPIIPLCWSGKGFHLWILSLGGN